MSIAREYTRVLRHHLRFHAAWPPTVTVAPGDYGVFVRGVFNRLGNISTDFGVDYVVEPGGRKAEKFLFQSSRETTGGARLDVVVSGVKAELDISLRERESFFVSVAEFDIERLQSPRNVAMRLRAHSQWPCLRYFVVWQTLKGHDLLFFGSEAGGAGVKISGDADDIKLLQGAGKLGGSLEFSTAGAVDVEFNGARDVPAHVGLNLFRVKAVGAEPLTLTFSAGATDEEPEPLEFLHPDDELEQDDANA